MNIMVETLNAKGHNITAIRMALFTAGTVNQRVVTSLHINNSAGGFIEELFETFASRIINILREGSTWGCLNLELDMWENA